MPFTNKREPKQRRRDRAHAAVMAEIKRLPRCLPDGFEKGQVTDAYFDYFMSLLRRHDYAVEEDDFDWQHGRSASARGNGVLVRFATDDCPGWTQGRLIADNLRCFNKDSQCPFVVKLPLTIQGEAEVLEGLRVLGSKDGYERAKGDLGGGESGFPYEIN
jgi:hypothetical protein